MTNTICFCNYSIGANAYEEVGATCKFYGKKILLIGGEKALAAGKARLEDAIAGSGLEIVATELYGHDCIPNISHISRLFALFMYDEVDDKRLAESVEALREFKVEDKDKWDYKWECSEDHLFDQNDNIYSILDQLLEDISGDELESDLDSYCTMKRFIQDIKESRQQILLERQIKEYIIKFDKTIKYCDKDSFAKALRRTYELEGLDESIIDAKVEESMEESTRRANNCFMNTAANFFVNDMNLQNVEN